MKFNPDGDAEELEWSQSPESTGPYSSFSKKAQSNDSQDVKLTNIEIKDLVKYLKFTLDKYPCEDDVASIYLLLGKFERLLKK